MQQQQTYLIIVPVLQNDIIASRMSSVFAVGSHGDRNTRVLLNDQRQRKVLRDLLLEQVSLMRSNKNLQIRKKKRQLETHNKPPMEKTHIANMLRIFLDTF